jgi:hypothetical protein
MPNPKQKYISKCCKDSVRIFEGEGTFYNYYFCDKCHKPCDFIANKSKKLKLNKVKSGKAWAEMRVWVMLPNDKEVIIGLDALKIAFQMLTRRKIKFIPFQIIKKR